MEDGGPDDGDVVEVSPGGRFKRVRPAAVLWGFAGAVSVSLGP